MTTAETMQRLRAEAGTLHEAGIVGLYLFGSVARGTAGETSDVDLFVDPDYDRFDFAALLHAQGRLQAALGCRVDLMTRASLHPMLRADIERDAIRVL